MFNEQTVTFGPEVDTAELRQRAEKSRSNLIAFSTIIAIMLTADIFYITNSLPTTSIIKRRRSGRLVRRREPLAVSIMLIPVQENVSFYVYFLLRCLARSFINIFVS